MKQYFIDCVRDNLHLILCMSPLNPKFPIRARYDTTGFFWDILLANAWQV